MHKNEECMPIDPKYGIKIFNNFKEAAIYLLQFCHCCAIETSEAHLYAELPVVDEIQPPPVEDGGQRGGQSHLQRHLHRSPEDSCWT